MTDAPLHVYVFTQATTWSSKKQSVVARSSTEAEYMALSFATTQILWLKALFVDLGIKLDPNPSVIWCDNIGATTLAYNMLFHARTKHIEVDVHFIGEKVADKDVEVRHIPSEDQITDVFTKALYVPQSVYLCNKLSLVHPAQFERVYQSSIERCRLGKSEVSYK